MAAGKSNTPPTLLIIFAVCLVAFLAYWGWRFLGTEQVASPEELAQVALSDAPEDECEAAALELARHPDRPVALVRRVFSEAKSPRVRAAAMVGLGTLRDWESMPELIEAMRSDSELTRQRASQAVDRIVGQPFGFDAAASAADRHRIIVAIESNWPLLYEGYKAQQEVLRQQQSEKGAGESP